MHKDIRNAQRECKPNLEKKLLRYVISSQCGVRCSCSVWFCRLVQVASCASKFESEVSFPPLTSFANKMLRPSEYQLLADAWRLVRLSFYVFYFLHYKGRR